MLREKYIKTLIFYSFQSKEGVFIYKQQYNLIQSTKKQTGKEVFIQMRRFYKKGGEMLAYGKGIQGTD